MSVVHRERDLPHPTRNPRCCVTTIDSVTSNHILYVMSLFIIYGVQTLARQSVVVIV